MDIVRTVSGKKMIKNPFLRNDGSFIDQYIKEEDKPELLEMRDTIFKMFQGRPLCHVQYILSKLDISIFMMFSEVVRESKDQ